MDLYQPEGGAWVGRSLGRFTILEPIGQGGMGEVYRGWDERLKKPVAIKSLRRALVHHDTARERFVRETRYGCRVNHPFVASVLDVVESGDEIFLVMEFIEGRRLDQVVQEDHPPMAQVLEWGIEIGEALEAIHQAGLVHRDLKPGNVLITSAGHVKVMDFGVARSIRRPEFSDDDGAADSRDGTLTRTGFGVGTVAYMSPEQVRGQDVDARSDLFSLGILLYRIVTGLHPFERDTPIGTASAIVHDPPGQGTEPRTLTESGPLRDVILRLLQKEPSRRYPSSAALVADLRAAARGKRLPTPRPPSPSRRWMAWASAAILAIVTLLVGWNAIRDRTGSGALEVRPAVAVLPFEDRASGVDGYPRGEMFADLLSAGLGDRRHLRAVTEERLEPVLAGFSGREGSAAGLRTGVFRFTPAEWVVTGRLHREGSSYHAAVAVYRNGSEKPAGSFVVSAASVASLADLARTEVTKIVTPAGGSGPENPAWMPREEEAGLLYQRARTAVREIRLLDASRHLERALQLDPGFLPAAILYARTLDASGYGTRALAASETALAIARGPGAPEESSWLPEARAVDAEIRGDLDAAVEERNSLAQSVPDDPERWIASTATLLRAGKSDEAVSALERAEALDPSDPRLLFLRARLGAIRRDPDAAMASLDSAEDLLQKVGSAAGVAEVWRERSRIERTRSRLEAAHDAAEEAERRFEAIGDDGGASKARFDRGAAALFLGRFAEAEALLESASRSANRRGDFRLVVDSMKALGASFYARGRNEEGESRLRQALDEARRLENEVLAIDPLLNLASLLCHTGRPGEGSMLAGEALDIAKRRGPRGHEVVALVLLADAEYQSGRIADAIRDYESAVSLSRDVSVRAEQRFWALDYLTELLDWTGEVSRAQDTNAKAMEIAAESGQRELKAYALLRRAELRAAVGDHRAARKDLSSLDDLVGKGDDALQDLPPRMALAEGTLAVFRGDPRGAEPFLRRAMTEGEASEVHGVEMPARIMWALARMQEGDVSELEGEIRTVVESRRATAPERVRARSVLARCLLALERWEDASNEARTAYEQGREMGLPVVVAEAAGVLLRLPPAKRPVDMERIRAEGEKALDAWEEHVPEADRAGFLARADLRPVFEGIRRE